MSKDSMDWLASRVEAALARLDARDDDLNRSQGVRLAHPLPARSPSTGSRASRIDDVPREQPDHEPWTQGREG